MKRKTLIKQPTKVNIGEGKFVYGTRAKYPYIELKGEPIESFERVSKIKEIILLGEDDNIRRIILK
jgi:hypothetical protein